jgi:hypothetical protein
MSTFYKRFEALHQLLDRRRSPTDGGWPQKLRLEESPTTIVATAQALEILRIRGLEFHDDQIQGGLRFLSEQVRKHTRPAGRDGGRGEFTRYPAYALWGLMRYPAALTDPNLCQGIGFSVKWLREHALPSGGWAEGREPGPLWLPGTMVAVHALDRSGIYGSSNAAGLTHTAREHVAANARQKTRKQSYWIQTDGGEPCPGATSLAVLTLARGTTEQREAARGGIEWLHANTSQWTQRVHEDITVDWRWRILTFSLGLRALMHPCGERDVDDPAVAEVVQHMDLLWKDHGWTDVPGMKEPLMSGSYAVISAVHTLKRVWQFDPFDDLRIAAPRSRRVENSLRPRRVLYVSPSQKTIRIVDNGTFVVQSHIAGRSQWQVLFRLATRHQQALERGSKNQTDMTVSLEECAQFCNEGAGVGTESVRRTVKRLHEKLGQEAKRHSRSAFVPLIDPHVPPGTTERRLALEETEVIFVEDISNEPKPPASETETQLSSSRAEIVSA